MTKRRRVVSAITSILVVSALSISCLAFSASAEGGQSIDDVINGNNTSVSQDVGANGDNGATANQDQNANYDGADLGGGVGADLGGSSGGPMVDEIKDATKIDGTSAGATKINRGIKKVASFIIQILSYLLTILLTLRVLCDLIYIVIPFSRGILGGGAQPAGGQPGMGGQAGMGMGMGMNGIGMGGMRGGMGMNGMAGGMGGQAGMAGQQGSGFTIVSNAAINAIQQPTPLKFYAKDMMITLIIVPILIILAVTGVLADLGFLLGDLIAKMIGGIGNML